MQPSAEASNEGLHIAMIIIAQACVMLLTVNCFFAAVATFTVAAASDHLDATRHIKMSFCSYSVTRVGSGIMS